MSSPIEPTLVLHNARVMTCDPDRPGLGIIDHGAIAIVGSEIAWVGADADRPQHAGARQIDLGGRLVTPGLVDCHTHAIFGGDRADEFEMRAAGKSYLEIAAAGGGIAASLRATRGAPDLGELLSARLRAALAGGTTTLEVKSGYDLTVAGELQLLDTILDVDILGTSLRIVPTLLAHVVPPERAADRMAYVAELCEQLVPEVARLALAKSVDVYCDEGAFTLSESRAILKAAKKSGLDVRAHVGQFRDLGGAELVAELGGLSVDHLEQVSDAGIAAIAKSGTVAVMLPGACVQLRLPVPPVEKLRAAGVTMAVASDLNPGSSFCETLPIQMWLATTHFGMTVEEAWLGVTRNAATALGLPIVVGVLGDGASADVVVWNCEKPAEVPYRYGSSLVDRVFARGVDKTSK